MNDLIVLAMLLPGPKHGYRLKREAGLVFSQGSLHSNTVYPLMRKYAAEGLVTQKTVKGQRGQTRKMYALTPKGRRTLIERLANFTEQDAQSADAFRMRVGLFDVLPPAAREQVLLLRENAIQARTKRLSTLRQGMELGTYGGEVVQHLEETAQAELKWVLSLRALEKKLANRVSTRA